MKRTLLNTTVQGEQRQYGYFAFWMEGNRKRLMFFLSGKTEALVGNGNLSEFVICINSHIYSILDLTKLMHNFGSMKKYPILIFIMMRK